MILANKEWNCPVCSSEVLLTQNNDENSVHAKLDSIITSMSFMSNQFDQMIKTNARVVLENAQLKQTVQKLENESDNLKQRVNNLEFGISQEKQRMYTNHLIISNVPVKTDENLFEIIEKIGAISDVKINVNDICELKRLNIGNKQTNQNQNEPKPKPPILVQFSSYAVKKKLMESRRKNGPIKLEQLEMQEEDNTTLQTVFLSHYLIKYFHQLYHQAREYKNKHTYKYLWFDPATIRILMREKEGSRIIAVNSIDVLTDLKGA